METSLATLPYCAHFTKGFAPHASSERTAAADDA
jgi:hypothetical protein